VYRAIKSNYLVSKNFGEKRAGLSAAGGELYRISWPLRKQSKPDASLH
jgi:preprotein translocase subunit SecE